MLLINIIFIFKIIKLIKEKIYILDNIIKIII